MFNVPDAFDPQSRPESFTDLELRQQVEALRLEYRQQEEDAQPRPQKRRRVTSACERWEMLSDQLFEILMPGESDGRPNLSTLLK
jgi:hypothetical protein